MSKKFLVSLAERVATTFLFTFFASFAFSLNNSSSFSSIQELSAAQKASVAAAAAVIQLILSVFVGSQVGDPDSAALLPLKRPSGPAPMAPTAPVVVSVDEIIKATLSRVAAKYPGVDIAATGIADEIIGGALSGASSISGHGEVSPA